MGIKSQSRINKGKRFEKLIAQEIEAEGLGIARREIGSGSGRRKGDIASSIPFLLECKNQPSAKIQTILNWIDQAKSQAEKGNWSPEKWALIFRDSRTPESRPDIYAVIDFWEFLKLMKKDQAPRIKQPDREMRWKIQRLIDSAKAVLKELKE